LKTKELINKVPLFKNLDDSDIEKIADIASEKSFISGEDVINEGMQGDSMYVIKYGTVRVLKKDEEVTRMSSGQHFGEMALISDEPRTATIQATERVNLIEITRDKLEDLMANDHALGHRVYKAFSKFLCNRLQQTTTDLSFMREKAKSQIHITETD
jgi:CRP-like cAMP-binding protein